MAMAIATSIAASNMSCFPDMRSVSIDVMHLIYSSSLLAHHLQDQLWPNLSKSMMTKSDGETAMLFPKAATLRNLTYSAPLYLERNPCKIENDLTEHREYPYNQGGYFIINESEKVLIAQEKMSTNYVYVFKKRQLNKYAYVGEVRSMTESQNRPPSGYFIINESEKVLIAQEKMSTNHVYVFKKRQPNKYAYVGEVRSMTESQNRPPSMMVVRILARTNAKGIHATLPYIKTKIPIIIVFRTLGFVVDKDILEHICYDFADTQVMELLWTSLK
nr:DNA-directed RNA polymerase II subunit RPB2 [Tanacetum cinerariifolium]